MEVGSEAIFRLGYVANDNVGVAAASFRVDGAALDQQAWPCDYTRTVPCANRLASFAIPSAGYRDGAHTLRLTATDAAGNQGAANYTFRSDNTAPGRVRPAVVGGEGWRRSNGFTVRWKNPPQAHAPIVRARYRLCSAARECREGSQAGRNIEQLSGLAVGRLGDNTLELWLEDEAGNQSRALASDPVHLRLDSSAPRLAFLPPDPSDPLAVAVRASDAHSGLAGGEIEMRLRGGRAWHELDTRLDAGRLVADIDDEGMRSGTYDFRARAIRPGRQRGLDQHAHRWRPGRRSSAGARGHAACARA